GDLFDAEGCVPRLGWIGIHPLCSPCFGGLLARGDLLDPMPPRPFGGPIASAVGAVVPEDTVLVARAAGFFGAWHGIHGCDSISSSTRTTASGPRCLIATARSSATLRTVTRSTLSTLPIDRKSTRLNSSHVK